MKLNRADLLRKCQFPLMLAFGSLPVPVVLLASMAPQALTLCWLLPAVYVLLTWLCIIIPGKRRVVAGVCCSAGIILLGFWALPVGESVLVLALPVIYAALLFYSLQIAAWPGDQEIAFNWYAAGVIAHMLAQLFVIASHRTGEMIYAPVEGMLAASFLGFLTLMLLSLNRSSMNGASLGRQRIPARMRSRNRLLTFAFLAIVLLVSAIPKVIELIEAAWNRAFSAFLALIEFILKLLPAQEEQVGAAAGGSGLAAGDFGGAAEPGLFAQIMEKIVMALAFVIAAGLLVLALRIIIRNLKKLLFLLAERLNRFAAAASEDYADEITDTREGGSLERGPFLSGLRRRMMFRDEARMSPTERIRYRYLRLLGKHPDWHAGTTARENLPENAAQLYELARYSGHPVHADEAKRFTEMTKDI